MILADKMQVVKIPSSLLVQSAGTRGSKLIIVDMTNSAAA
jgi:hypothetical protein